MLLAGLGYPADPMLGPTVALYLLAVSRERERRWTWRIMATVVGMLVCARFVKLLARALGMAAPLLGIPGFQGW